MTDRLAELRAKCTEKQARWAEELLANGGNATEAARAAGYRGDDAALGRQGADNRKNPKIAAYLEALRAELYGGPVVVRLEAVRDRLATIGFGHPIPQYVRGRIVLMPPKASDQRGALRTLAQMLGGLDAKVQVQLGSSLRTQLEGLRARMPEEAFVALLRALAALQADEAETVDVEVLAPDAGKLRP